MNLSDRMKEQDKKNEKFARVERSMTNITPGAAQVKRIEGLREVFKDAAWNVIESTDISREQSLALTHLEDALMWAVKAIVLEEGK